MRCSRKEKDEEDVKNVGLGISDWAPDIWDPKQPIVKINDGSLATQDMVENVLNAEQKDGELLQKFISRFTTGNAKLKYNDPIKRQKVYTFEIPQGKKKFNNRGRKRISWKHSLYI